MNSRIQPGKPASLEIRKEKARQAFEGLAFFALLRSPDPKLQDAVDKLNTLRCQVQEQLEILAPGYAEEVF